MTEINYSQIDLKDLASLIYSTLNQNGIEAILVGGACVTIYSQNEYQSYDLDFITYQSTEEVERVLLQIGFKKEGRYFVHENCPFFIDFINPPIAIGNQPVKEFNLIKTEFGMLKLLTPLDCVKDRLAAFYHWGDKQSFQQALQVAKKFQLDIEDLKNWSKSEGHLNKFKIFEQKLLEC